MRQSEDDVYRAERITEFRRRTASTKVTDEEFRAMESFARKQGQSISEWIRQTLLAEARSQGNGLICRHIFVDVVGTQMLLISALESLLCGERLTREEIAQRFRQVQKAKAAQAQELLTRRSQIQEK